MNVLLEKSIADCHCKGLDSIVIKDKPGMIRLFVARRDHQLYLNEAANPARLWSVALHRHHCDVTMHPLTGEVYNISVSDLPSSTFVKMRSYRYDSPITGHGKFTPVEDRPIPMPLRTDLLSRGPRFLQANELHSVYVPYGQVSAWYIWEGAEDPKHNPLVYSNANLTDFDFSTVNHPMTEERLREDLNLIGVHTFQI